MRNSASPLYILMLMIGDFFALVFAFVTAYIIRVNIDTRPLVAEVTSDEYLKVFLILLPIWIIIFASLNLYRREVYEQKVPETARLLVGSFIGILLVIGYEFVSGESVFPARLVALYGLLGSFVLLFAERSFLRALRKHMFKYGVGVRRMMIIGSSEATKSLAELLHDTEATGYEIKAILGNKTVLPKEFKGVHYTDLENALSSVGRLGVNTIVQTHFFDDPKKNQMILRTAQDKHLAYRLIPTQDEFFTGNHSVELFHGFPVVAVHQTRLFGWQKIIKRVFDIGTSLLALPFVFLLMIIFGIAIKIEDPKGPIFYKSRRVTRYGNKFTSYKFRSMQWKYCTKPGGKTDIQILRDMGRDDLARQIEKGDQQLKDDPRIMKVGRILRRTSLDEVPQFWNVLKGDMSLVGPRAISPKDMQLYKEQKNLLLSVKTGLTGLAQVSGRSHITYEERAKLNLYYVQNWSFLLDIRIILRTITAVIRGDNTK